MDKSVKKNFILKIVNRILAKQLFHFSLFEGWKPDVNKVYSPKRVTEFTVKSHEGDFRSFHDVHVIDFACGANHTVLLFDIHIDIIFICIVNDKN